MPERRPNWKLTGSVLSQAAPQPAGTAAFLHDAFFALDGHSAGRVADLLASLAGGSR